MHKALELLTLTARVLRLLWDRLDQRFGSPERIESVLMGKLLKFQKIGFEDSLKLYELTDLLPDILSLKEQPMYQSQLAYFDYPIIEKLPNGQVKSGSQGYRSSKKQKDGVFHHSSCCEFCLGVESCNKMTYSETVSHLAKSTRSPTYPVKTRIPSTTT